MGRSAARWMGWILAGGLAVAACTPRATPTPVPLPSAAAALPATPPAALPTATPGEVDLPPTATPAVDLLPTPTPGPLVYTSAAGGFRLQLPLPWHAVAADLDARAPITGAVELAAIRPGEGAATLTVAVVAAHGLTLEQWLDATAAEMVLAGFAVKATGIEEVAGEEPLTVARITYQPPAPPNAPPTTGVQLAWFAPDDRLVLATFTVEAAAYPALLPEIDQMLATLDLAAGGLPN